jgi:hypothetical protein
MLTAAQSDLVRELAAARAAGERSSKHGEALKAQLEAEKASAGDLAKQLQAVRSELAAAQQQLLEVRQQLEVEEAGRREAESQLAAVQQQAQGEVQGARTQAAALVQGLRLRFFRPPGSQSCESQSQCRAAGGGTTEAPGSSAHEEGFCTSSSAEGGITPGQVDSHLSGPSPCQLSHDQLMEAFQGYLQRQAHIRAQVEQQQSQPNASSSKSPSKDDPHEELRALDVELLWLEGCLLLSLVEMRAAQRQAHHLAEELQGVCSQQHTGRGGAAAGASQVRSPYLNMHACALNALAKQMAYRYTCSNNTSGTGTFATQGSVH